MKGPETAIRKRIQEAIKEKYGDHAFTVKIHGNEFQEVGLPDLICCIFGVFFGFEVKVPGKRAKPAQKAIGVRITKAEGVFATVCGPTLTLNIIKKELEMRNKI